MKNGYLPQLNKNRSLLFFVGSLHKASPKKETTPRQEKPFYCHNTLPAAAPWLCRQNLAVLVTDPPQSFARMEDAEGHMFYLYYTKEMVT